MPRRGSIGRRSEDLYSAMQINISENDITIDVYVDFRGDENLTTDNGLLVKIWL